MSYGGQGSTIQGSSPHKCNQEVWWDALNMGIATTPSVMSRLTPLRNFFSVVGPLLAMCHWRGFTVRACSLFGLAMDSSAMDMTCGTEALFKFLYPTIAPQNSVFFSLIRGEKWGFDFGILTPHVSLISTCESIISCVPQPFWRFGVCNVPLNALDGALFPTSYGGMEILRLALLLKIWGG